MLALLKQSAHLLGIDFELTGLKHQSGRWRQEVAKSVAANPGLATYVGSLEKRSESSSSADLTGDAIAAEVERYLAHRDE